MILTPLNIQVAIIKAFYALAKKSVKYYTGLAFGKNNTCLFKEIRLLRAYIEILRNFEIVGSTITCSCCVEGDYTVLLNSDLPVTNTPIEFNCDNQGYIVYNNIGYNFTYWYDEPNQKIVIDFTGSLNDVVITITDVQFTDTCNITGNAVSPIEVATIDEILNTPVTVDNDFGTWDGSIAIYESDGTTPLSPPISLTIPAADMDNVEAILELWNTTYPEWILQYFEGQFVLYSPFDNINYNGYIVKFNQYEGGSDSFIDFDLSSVIPFVTQGTPAHANILFEQNTFTASHVAETLITLPSTALPYVDTPTLAQVDILIPINQFAAGQSATMVMPLLELFNSTAQDFYYEGNLMFSHSGAYTDMLELINDFNTSNGLGFTAFDGGFQPINEVLATASNTTTTFNGSIVGDVYTARLVNTPLAISDTIGTYEVVAGNSPSDIANFIAADIIAQGTYTGTVSVTGTVITLTAPLGTGDSWNFNAGVSTYAFSIQKTGSRASIFYFNGGEASPTTPIHLLDIVAPNIYPQTDYNDKVITIEYPVEFYEPDGAQFAGAVDDTAGVITIDDDLNGTIYTSSITFTSIESMLINFGFNSTPAAVGNIIGTSGSSYIVRIELEYPPGYAYNGTTLRYEFNPDGPGRVYNSSGVYFGGNDTTESIYTLIILDGNDDPFLTVVGPGNFQDYQAIVDDLNSQSPFNTDFIASLSGTDIVITTLPSLQGTEFNEYTFQLVLGYDSIQYATTYDFVTSVSEMSGGIDAVSPEVNFVNDYNATTIYNLPQNSYDVDGINGFVNLFNDDSPDNYSAEFLGTFQNLPEILSESLLNMINLNDTIPNTVVRAFYTTSIFAPPVLIGTFTPTISAEYTANGVAAGLASAINLNPWTGSAVAIASTLKLLAPSGTFGSYNNYITGVTLKIPNVRAATVVTVSAGNTLGAGTLELSVVNGATTTSLGIQSITPTQSASQWAVAYANRINSGTGTHGFTASAAVGRTTISIFAPNFTGTILNGATISVTQAIGGVAIVTTPTPTFNGGTDIITTIATNVFLNGGYTIYDRVKFTADPDEQTWIYNGEDFIYTDVTNSYSYSGEFAGGIDTTIGSLSLLLAGSSIPFFPGTSPYTLYSDGSSFNYSSFQQWVTAINTSTTNLDFSASNLLTNFRINSPLNSFAYFNGSNDIELFYTYDSPQYTGNNYGQLLPIENGVDPVLETYEGIFESGVLGNFINANPCTPTVAEQTCLTNNQVSKIITHINKLTK